MKKVILACVASFLFASQSGFALEPWHDYYRAKAKKEKAAKQKNVAQQTAVDGTKATKSPTVCKAIERSNTSKSGRLLAAQLFPEKLT